MRTSCETLHVVETVRTFSLSWETMRLNNKAHNLIRPENRNGQTHQLCVDR